MIPVSSAGGGRGWRSLFLSAKIYGLFTVTNMERETHLDSAISGTPAGQSAALFNAPSECRLMLPVMHWKLFKKRSIYSNP